MAEGNVTADKWARIAAWIPRHIDDLNAPAASPDHPAYPSPGVVAMALWGAGVNRNQAERALEYARGVVGRIEEENDERSTVTGEAKSKLETRHFSGEMELRETPEGMRLEGYAARFNEFSEPLPFREKIAPGAFKRSLQSRNDVKLLWNHDSSTVLGSTRAGTLTLTEDEYGLRVSAELPDTQAGRDARVLIQRRDVTAFSFGFTVPKGGDTWSSDGSERTLNSVRLFEVSTGVAFPAYPTTEGTATVRGLARVAQRAQVDVDALADAVLKIENGEDISSDDRVMIESVLNELAPAPEEAEPAVSEDEEKARQLLQLKKKKLQLLMGF
jgi:HK97 family phage prohead protease